ncbi:hypothetical protein [Salinigranum salinum]|uniref:hypothetical protein n=1 Tax=Salinigranum salinum TaxID=1364937 RepID=UPI0012606060|nr:hypothetical protein [Salinigranum salinum]
MSRLAAAPTLDPRRSALPATAVFALGLGLFLLDATSNPRPGPVAYLLTPTPVAVLLYVRDRPTTGRRRLLALGAWGFVGTTAAGLLTVLVALGTRLPRPYEAWEFFLLDLGVFLWFVVALAGAFVVAARQHGRRERLALAAGPVAQFGGFLLTTFLTAEAVVLFGVVVPSFA